MLSQQFGYRILPRAEFMALDRLEGFLLDDYSKTSMTEAGARELDERNVQLLKERAGRYEGAYVLYDPYADEDGFMLVGDDPAELDRQCYENERAFADA